MTAIPTFRRSTFCSGARSPPLPQILSIHSVYLATSLRNGNKHKPPCQPSTHRSANKQIKGPNWNPITHYLFFGYCWFPSLLPLPLPPPIHKYQTKKMMESNKSELESHLKGLVNQLDAFRLQFARFISPGCSVRSRPSHSGNSKWTPPPPSLAPPLSSPTPHISFIHQ